MILINLYDFYDDLCYFLLFGFLDYNIIVVELRICVSSCLIKYVFKCDMWVSCKVEMGRFLSSMDWFSLFIFFESCEDMLSMFCEIIYVGFDFFILVKKVCVCLFDVLWMI